MGIIQIMRQGAVVIMMRNDGAVLMQLRDNIPNIPYPDHWALPSGAVEGEETPWQAAQRELLEETRYVAERGLELFTAPQKINGKEVQRHVFLVNYDGNQEIECLEGRAMEFKKPEELSELKVFGDHIEFISRAKEMIEKGGIENKS